MMKFIRESLAELEHVVWPTPTETRKYMNYTVGVIIVMSAFLALLSYSLRGSLGFVRDQFPHDPTTQVTASSEAATEADVDKLLEKIGQKKTATGTTQSTSTGTKK